MGKRKIELLTRLPEGEAIVGIVNFQEKVIVATTLGIYQLVDDQLEAIPIEMEG